MELSIIIPTYNRAEELRKCLDCLRKQSFKNFEVIIVDDGSSDNTREVVQDSRGLKLSYIYQDHKQQGVARNRGVKKARGRYVAFIGDDIFVRENWAEEHMRVHKETGGVAVLGLTLWDERSDINDFMRYLAPNGPQFNYGAIKKAEDCGWGYFWTSNISLEKKWFDKERFDENFRGWGYEDLELGYRLEKRGLRIVFNKEAIGYHCHHYADPEGFLRKQEGAAKSAIYFAGKFPELKEELIERNRLKLWHRLLLIFFLALPFLKRNRKLKIIYWKLRRRYYFSRGLK